MTEKNKRFLFVGSALFMGLLAWIFIKSGIDAYKTTLKPQTSDMPQSSFQFSIPMGFRALTVPISLPFEGGEENVVDVLFSYESGESSRVMTLLQNVPILSPPWRGEDQQFYASFLVTPEEAQLLIYSWQKGKLFISVRHERDHAVDPSLLHPLHHFTEDSLLDPHLLKSLQEKTKELVKKMKGN